MQSTSTLLAQQGLELISQQSTLERALRQTSDEVEKLRTIIAQWDKGLLGSRFHPQNTSAFTPPMLRTREELRQLEGERRRFVQQQIELAQRSAALLEQLDLKSWQ